MAFTGDLISMAPDELESTAPILRRISAKDGVVSVLGNHDYSPYTDVDEEIRKRYVEELVRTEKGMGWNLLIDSHEKICRGEDSIAVIGVQNISSSRHFHSQGDLSKASEGTEGMFSILLSGSSGQRHPSHFVRTYPCNADVAAWMEPEQSDLQAEQGTLLQQRQTSLRKCRAG